MKTRTEKDYLGTVEIDADALYGIHAKRAQLNFETNFKFSKEWYKATAECKKAAYQAVIDLNLGDKTKFKTLIQVCDELITGQHFEHLIVPAICGGAGTSFNMNINEIITNRALEILGKSFGSYEVIDPIEHANIFQSTNDVMPSALRIAIYKNILNLENSILEIIATLEKKDKEFGKTFRISYTQMQKALPSTFHELFEGYIHSIKRDFKRVSTDKKELLKINLGGGATGNRIGIPKDFTKERIKHLANNLKLEVVTKDSLIDATINFDDILLIHSDIKIFAATLYKIAFDLRLLSSELLGKEKNVSIPQKQVGSSIMPAKINPVIPEFVISVCEQIFSSDMLISKLVASGNLDLNPYLPLIGHSALSSIEIITTACNSLKNNLIDDLFIVSNAQKDQMLSSLTITTLLVEQIGYNNSSLLSKEMKEKNCDVITANKNLKIIEEKKLLEILKDI